MNRPFRTKDIHLAALLRNELGKETQVGIVFDERGTAFFEFDRHPQCLAIMQAYYANGADSDFATGYAVNDARALLKEATAVRKEMAIARDKWRASQKDNLQ